MNIFIKLILALVVSISLGCAGSTQSNAPTLYDRLGKNQGISDIVDSMLYDIASNEKLIEFFIETDLDRFRTKLIEMLCEVSDGPCEYTGDSMKQVHESMAIDKSHFDALVTSLVAAMDENNVEVGAQNDLLARLVPYYPEVIPSN
ncbi:group 1 truncated hemoglobin [Reinekea marina]|uniref:Group 1 truncated hemoglobin n=1 Tax=Reinekea marina TaxID=1310421 RepID=A0ABV7WRH8_9GAMM|nr:group 1 truncated hemoglobin [Reinekea marina]MDN3647582.1 group 1 truncated hemoglobin [Reinekea marina]